MKRLSLLLLAVLCATQAWADTKISALPLAAAQTGTEVIPESQAGQCASTGGTCGVLLSQIKTYTNASVAAANLTGQTAVANGGTGLATITAHGLMVGEGTSPVAPLAAMAADTVLMGQGASVDPAPSAVTNCGDTSHAVSYSTSTHAWGCQAISAGGTPTTLQGTSSSTNANYPIYAANGTTPVFDSVFTVSLNPATHTVNATTFAGNATSATIATTLTTTQSSANANFPPVLANGTTMQWDSGVLINPSTHTVTATSFVGAHQLTVGTLASLPTCNAGTKGTMYGISDATAPTYNATAVGGGAVSIPVYCNGTNWTAH